MLCDAGHLHHEFQDWILEMLENQKRIRIIWMSRAKRINMNFNNVIRWMKYEQEILIRTIRRNEERKKNVVQRIYVHRLYYETYSLRLFCYFSCASQIFHSKWTLKLNTMNTKKRPTVQFNTITFFFYLFVILSVFFSLLSFLSLKIRINFFFFVSSSVWNSVFAPFWRCVICDVNLSI